MNWSGCSATQGSQTQGSRADGRIHVSLRTRPEAILEKRDEMVRIEPDANLQALAPTGAGIAQAGTTRLLNAELQNGE